MRSLLLVWLLTSIGQVHAAPRPNEAVFLDPRYRLPSNLNPLETFPRLRESAPAQAGAARAHLSPTEGVRLDQLLEALDPDEPHAVAKSLSLLLRGYLLRTTPERRATSRPKPPRIAGLLVVLQDSLIEQVNQDLDAIQTRIRRLARLQERREGLEKRLAQEKERRRVNAQRGRQTSSRPIETLSLEIQEIAKDQAELRRGVDPKLLTLEGLQERRDQRVVDVTALMRLLYDEARVLLAEAP